MAQIAMRRERGARSKKREAEPSQPGLVAAADAIPRRRTNLQSPHDARERLRAALGGTGGPRRAQCGAGRQISVEAQDLGNAPPAALAY